MIFSVLQILSTATSGMVGEKNSITLVDRSTVAVAGTETEAEVPCAQTAPLRCAANRPTLAMMRPRPSGRAFPGAGAKR